MYPHVCLASSLSVAYKLMLNHAKSWIHMGNHATGMTPVLLHQLKKRCSACHYSCGIKLSWMLCLGCSIIIVIITMSKCLQQVCLPASMERHRWLLCTKIGRVTKYLRVQVFWQWWCWWYHQRAMSCCCSWSCGGAAQDISFKCPKDYGHLTFQSKSWSACSWSCSRASVNIQQYCIVPLHVPMAVSIWAGWLGIGKAFRSSTQEVVIDVPWQEVPEWHRFPICGI